VKNTPPPSDATPRFVAALRPLVAKIGGEPAQLETFVTERAPEVWDSATREWPGVDVAPEDFAGAVAERLAQDDRGEAHHWADLYIAFACTRGVAHAAQALERAYFNDLSAKLRELENDAAFVDEVLQQLRTEVICGTADVAPRIQQYSGRGVLLAWLRIAAVRLGLNQLKRLGREAAEPLSQLGEIAISGPEDRLLREERREVFKRALEQALAKLADRERLVLRMSVVDGASIDDIGGVFRVHRATAARWLGAAKERLSELARAEAKTLLGENTTGVNSALNALQSELELSLPRLLKGP
jgi:RNA polymerase sigma-70 factor (ECF subfamily)